MNIKCFFLEPTGNMIWDADSRHGEHEYRRTDTGETMTLSQAPPGAMWDATWWHDDPGMTGWDGRALVVRTPGKHDWPIDARASNCGSPGDNQHKCWCRHGEPPNITVDKNCHTCIAGAGSISYPDYHGMLTNGELIELPLG